MKDLISHIEFLILRHNCVIIPDFGGFVLNNECAYVDSDGRLVPPKLVLGFNADLKFNDGLLSESYMQSYSISYEAACGRIGETVKRIKLMLKSGQTLNFGKLGDMHFIEERLVFEPTFTNSDYPDTWGYVVLNIRQLKDVEIVPEIKMSILGKVRLKHILITATSAAAIIAFFALPMSFKTNFLEKTQEAGFFTTYTTNTGKKITADKVVLDDKSFVLENFVTQLERETKDDVSKQESSVKQNDVQQATTTNNKRYYIIVAGDTDKVRANKLLSGFKNKGFKNASIVEGSDRFRVYVASFENKNEANSYLDSFKKKNSSFSDAWLFTKRVK